MCIEVNYMLIDLLLCTAHNSMTYPDFNTQMNIDTFDCDI